MYKKTIESGQIDVTKIEIDAGDIYAAMMDAADFSCGEHEQEDIDGGMFFSGPVEDGYQNSIEISEVSRHMGLPEFSDLAKGDNNVMLLEYFEIDGDCYQFLASSSPVELDD